jgi:hypothetical protein
LAFRELHRIIIFSLSRVYTISATSVKRGEQGFPPGSLLDAAAQICYTLNREKAAMKLAQQMLR